MRPALFRIVLLSMFLTLAATGVASAHVAVSPEEVPAGSYEKLTVSVPTERDVPTTQVRLEAPQGFEVLGVQPVPGWDYEFEENVGVVESVTWSGGEIGPRERSSSYRQKPRRRAASSRETRSRRTRTAAWTSGSDPRTRRSRRPWSGSPRVASKMMG